MTVQSSPRTLGRSSLVVPRLGIGAMTWGEARGIARLHPAKTAFGGAHGSTEEETAFAASLAAGVSLFDTAAMYSGGASEMRLGELARGTNAILATKFPASLLARAGNMPRDDSRRISAVTISRRSRQSLPCCVILVSGTPRARPRSHSDG
jgi:aryl-alcohol dehydrogenase-like predicted oxidoreductase